MEDSPFDTLMQASTGIAFPPSLHRVGDPGTTGAPREKPQETCAAATDRDAGALTRKPRPLWNIALGTVAILCSAHLAWGQNHLKPKTDAEIVANAMSAAPPSISKQATIIAMDGDKMRVVRKGTNGFTCMPDDPGSPGNDPMCLDANGMLWLQAWMDHKDAPRGKPGLVYMLQGGSDASNDDPFATQPPSGKKWVTTGPHVMVVGVAGSLGDYPKSADVPTRPFVMWGGSSYEHIMMPVK
jgi:hypothetical protein